MIWPLSLFFPRKREKNTQQFQPIKNNYLQKTVPVLDDSKVFHTTKYNQPTFKNTGSKSEEKVAHYDSGVHQSDDNLTELLLLNSVLNDDFKQDESYGMLSEDSCVDASVNEDFGGGDFGGGGAGSDWSDNSSSDSSYDSSSSDSSSSDCGSSD